jgi:hypothetical protein
MQLWKMLAESATETLRAMNEHNAAQGPETRARVDTTFSEYIACLAPIIGETAAFQLHASWQAYLDSIDRRTRLLGALWGRSNIAAADVETVRQLQSEAEAALAALEDSDAATRARINEAVRADGPIGTTA